MGRGKSLRISLAKIFDKCARAEQNLTHERAENGGKCRDLVSNQDNCDTKWPSLSPRGPRVQISPVSI